MGNTGFRVKIYLIFGIFHNRLKVGYTFFFAKLCEKLCETLREIDNQIFHAEFRKVSTKIIQESIEIYHGYI